MGTNIKNVEYKEKGFGKPKPLRFIVVPSRLVCGQFR